MARSVSLARGGKLLNSLRRNTAIMAAVAAVCAGYMGAPAHAGTAITWSATAGGTTWAVGSNWVGGTAPANDLTSNIALFDSASYTNQPDAGTSSINGVQIGDGTTLTLGGFTLSGTLLTIGSGGITMYANAGASTINSPLSLGATQSWTNNSVNLLAIGGNIANGANLLTVAGSGSTSISGILGNGSGGLTKTGAGVLTLAAADTYTGATLINGGTVTLSGANGAITSSSGITLSSRAALTLDDTTNNADRLGNAIPITSNGGVFTFSNPAAAATSYSESIGAVTLNSGALDIVTSQAASGQTSTLTIASMARNAGGTVLFTGTGLGGAANTRNLVTVSSAGTGWTLSNNIIPWALLFDGTTYRFVGSTTGPLTAYTAYEPTPTNWTAATVNARPTVNLTPAGGTTYTMNSLTLDSGINLGQPSGTGDTTLAIGANGLATIVQTGGTSILDKKSGGHEYIASMATGTELIVDVIGTLTWRHGNIGAGATTGNIAWAGASNTSNRITKTGPGTWNISDPAGTNDSGGWDVSTNMTGAFTINQGTVRINGNAGAVNANALGSGTLVMNSGTLSLGNNADINFARNTTIAGDATIVADNSAALTTTRTYTFGTLSLGANTLTITRGSNITGAGVGSLTFLGTTLTGNAIAALGTGTLLTVGAVTDGGKTLTLTGAGSFGQSAAWGAGSGGGLTLAPGYTGIATLSQANAYTGPTTINGGTLALTSAGSINSSPISIGGGGTFNVAAYAPYVLAQSLNAPGTGTATVIASATGVSVTGKTINMQDGSNLGTLAFSTSLALNGATLRFDLGSTGSDLLQITGAAALSGTNTINVAALASTGSLSVGVTAYTLITAASGLSNTNFSLGTPSLSVGGTTYYLALGGDASHEYLGVSSINPVTWTGAAGTTWDTSVTVSPPYQWKNTSGGAPASYVDGVFVTFDDGEANTTGIVIQAANVAPGNVSFINTAATPYSFSAAGGGITGTSSVTISGGGVVTFNNANDYSGATIISNGTLNLNATSALSKSSITVTGTGNLAESANNAISGSAALTISGAGVNVTLGNANNYTGSTSVAAGTLNLSAAGAISASAITVSGTGNLAESVDNAISGGSALTINGPATTLARANNYSGLTTITVGTLQVNADSSLGTAAAGTMVSGTGAALLLNNVNYATAEPLTLNGTGVASGGALANTGTSTFNGTITLGSSSTINAGGGTLNLTGGMTSGSSAIATFAGSGSVNINSGAIMGNAGLTVNGPAVALNVASSYSGATSVTSGTLALGAAGAISGSAVTISGTGNLTESVDNAITGGSSLTISGPTVTLANANSYTGVTNVNSGTLALGAAGAINGSVITVSGTGNLTEAIDNAIAGGSSLTINGASLNVALAHANFYTGLTTITAGKIQVNSDSGLGSAAAGTTVASGAALQLNNVNYMTAEALALIGTGIGGTGALVANGSSTFAGPITIGTGGATISTGGSTLTLTGGVSKSGTTATFIGGGTVNINSVGISGAAANSDLVIIGTTMNLNVASTYNGPTTVRSGGTIVAGVMNALPITTTLTLGEAINNTNGIFDLGGNSQTITGLYTAGTGGPSNVVTNTSLSSDALLSVGGGGVFAGKIQDGTTHKTALTVSGGALTLSGANIYTGATTINPSATLAVTGSLASSVSVTSGGTLSGSGIIGGAVTVSSDSAGGILTPHTVVGGTATLTITNSLTLNSGSVLNFNLGTFNTAETSANDKALGLTSLTLSGPITLNVNMLGTSGLGGTYEIFGGFGALLTGDHNSFNVVGSGAYTYAVLDANNGGTLGEIRLQALLRPTFTWTNGGSTGSWNTSDSNWNGTGGSVYVNGGPVVFDDGAPGTISLPGTVNPYTVTVNGTTSYTLTGAGSIADVLGGNATTLTQNSSGTLTMNATNTYSGGTSINAGTVAIGTNTALGSGTVTIGNTGNTTAATLAITGPLTIAASGAGSFPIALGNSSAAITATGGTVTINSIISNAPGATTFGLALNGNFVLGGSNTFTGITNLVSGSLSVATVANAGIAQPLGETRVALGSGTTLNYTGVGFATSLPIAVNAGGATIHVSNPATTLALNGAITTGPLTITGGTVALGSTANANTFSSLTVGSGSANSGTVSIAVPGNLPAAAIPVNLNGGTMSFTAAAVINENFNVQAAGGTLNSTTGSLNLTGSTLTGSGPLTISGSGGTSLTPAAASSFSGILTVAAGSNITLSQNAIAGMSAASGGIIFANNFASPVCTLNSAFNTTAPITFLGVPGGSVYANGSSWTLRGALTGTGANSGFTQWNRTGNDVYGGITLAGTADNLDFSLLVAGPTYLAKTSSPTVHAIGAGGTLTIPTANTVTLGNAAGTLGSGDYQIADNATVAFADTTSTLDLHGFNARLGNVTGPGTITNSAAVAIGMVNFGANALAGTFTGSIKDGAGKTAVGVINNGTVTLTSGSSNYTGGTNIQYGTLKIGAANSLPTSTTVTFGTNTPTAGTLDLAGFNQTVGGLAVASGAPGYAQVIGNSSAGTPSVLTFTNSTTPSTFAGTIQDTLASGSSTTALTVSASSNLTLSGTSTYTGATSVSGTLVVSGALQGNTAVTVNTGGTLLVTGAVGSTVTVNSAGTLQVGDSLTNNGTLAGNISLGASDSAVVFANPTSTAYTGSISGAGTLTKLGPGKLTLTNAGGYSGATTLSAGSLTLNGTQATSGVTVGNGTTLVSDGSLAVSHLAFGSGSGDTATLGLTVGSTVATTPVTVTASDGLTANGAANSVTLNVSFVDVAVHEYSLLAFAGSIGGTGQSAFQLGTLPSRVNGYLDFTAPGLIQLNITHADSPKWQGNDGTNPAWWDINHTQNWVLKSDGSTLTTYLQNAVPGDIAQFDDSAIGTNVEIRQDVSPAAVTFQTSKTFTFTGVGAITGTTGLSLSGGGTVILSNSNGNNYTGTTTVSDGTLTLAAASAVSGSALTISGAGHLTESADNAIGGTASLTINGPAVALGNANNFTGATRITGGGTLQLSNANAIASSALTLTSGTLQLRADSNTVFATAGTTIGGTVTIDVNQLASGSANTLSLGAVSMGAYTLNVTGGNGDSLALGAVTLTGNAVFNPTSASVTIASATCTIPRSLTLQGSATSNAVGPITTGSGTVLVSSGTWAFTGVNSYTGGTTLTGGVLNVNADAALGAATGTVTFAGGTLQAGAPIVTLNSARPVTISNGAIALFDTNSNAMSVGTITGAASAGLTKTGPGTLTLTAASTYAGATLVSNGVLKLGAAPGAGTGFLPAATPLLLANGGTFDPHGYSQVVDSLADSSSGGLVTTSAATLSTLTLATTSTTTFSGSLQDGAGQIALTVSGAGNQHFAGSSNYTGATSVTGGTLSLDVANAIAASPVSISGGTLSVNTSNTMGSVGVTLAGGTLNGGPGTNFVPNATTATVNSTLTATGTLALNGNLTINPTVVLSSNPAGTVDLSAATLVNNGTLNAVGGLTTFGAHAASGKFAVQSAGTLTAGSMSSSLLTLNGSGIVNLGNTGSPTVSTVATLAVGGSSTPTLNLNTNAYLHASAITVPLLSVLKIGPNSSNDHLLTLTGGLASVTGGGQVDITNNDVIIQGQTAEQVRAAFSSSYNSGLWNGSGLITSLTTVGNTSHASAAIGYLSQADFATYSLSGNIDGYTPASGDVVAMYTYAGDVNLDGYVDIRDYLLMDQGYMLGFDASSPAQTAHWVNGDVNYDGIVDFKDFAFADAAAFDEGGTVLANQMYQLHAAEFGQAYINAFDAAVPEPASLLLLGLGAAGLLLRR